MHLREDSPSLVCALDGDWTAAFDSADLQVREVMPTETFTVDQLAEAVKTNDCDRVRQILGAQPDLVRTDMAYENGHKILHYAHMVKKLEPSAEQ